MARFHDTGGRLGQVGMFVHLLVLAAAAAIAGSARGQCEDQKILASDGQVGDYFGAAIAMDGDLAIVGAWAEPMGYVEGSAYIYRFDGTAWTEEAVLEASDGFGGNRFGASVAIRGDTAVVGAREDDDNGPESGSVYVYRFDGSSWIEDAKILAWDGDSGDWFGDAVAMEADLLVVGAPRDENAYPDTGSAYVFRYEGPTWVPEQKLLGDNSPGWFGDAIAVAANAVVVGASQESTPSQFAGAAYVFRHDGLTWVQEAKLTPPQAGSYDQVGTAVALCGDVLIAGAPDHFSPVGGGVGAAYIYRYDGNTWVQEARLSAPSTPSTDAFGGSVALAGEVALIGAAYESHNGYRSGAAYAYAYDAPSASWVPTVELLASDGEPNDRLGGAIAYSGSMALVGAHGHWNVPIKPGAAYAYADLTLGEDCNGNFISDACEIAAGLAEDCQPNGVPDECDIANGTSGDINGNGIPDECELYGLPCQMAVLQTPGNPGNEFGIAVAVDGSVAIVGDYCDDQNGENAGAAWVSRFDGVEWVEEQKLLAADGAVDDYFGESVAIDGDLVLIGAPGDDDNGNHAGSAYVFRFNGSTWLQEAKLLASDGRIWDRHGCSVALLGDVAVVGTSPHSYYSTSPGYVYVYRYSPDPHGGGRRAWVEEHILHASDGAEDDSFGYSVAMIPDAIIVGAVGDGDLGDDSGSAYVFRYDGQMWNEEAKLLASDGDLGDLFGCAVGIDENVVIVGARRDEPLGPMSGSAYVYRHDGTTWIEEAKLVDSDGDEDDCFGYSVAIGGHVALVGAYYVDGSTGPAGWVRRFTYEGGAWIERERMYPSGLVDPLGASIGFDGDVAICGAPLGQWPSAVIFAGLNGLDCNGNLVGDTCDIFNGTSPDLNGNGIPDECETPGDVNGDGVINVLDLLLVLGAWGPCAACPEDINGDGTVDVLDLLVVLANWT